MAIKGKLTTSSGITLNEAYVNTSHIYINKQILNGVKGFLASFDAVVYANSECYMAKNCVETFSLQFTVNKGEDILEQAYKAIKSSNRLEEMEDC